MSPVNLSVVGGYRGSRNYNTRGDCRDHGGYWDPLIWGRGPLNVFSEAEIDIETNTLKEKRIRINKKCTIRGNNNETKFGNDNHDNNNNNEDRRNDEPRHNGDQSYQTLS